MKTITALQALGYTVAADGDSLRLRYTGVGEPDAGVVGPLVDDLRANKAATLAYLRLPLARRSATEEEAWWARVGAERSLALAQIETPHLEEAWERALVALGHANTYETRRAYAHAAIRFDLPFMRGGTEDLGPGGWLAWAEEN